MATYISGRLGELLDTLKQARNAYGTGIASGMTAGLSKYVTAAEAWVADRARNIMNSTPGITWDQAVQYAGEEQNSLRQSNPYATTAGELVGSVALGAGIGKTAQAVGNVARGAGILGRALSSPVGQAGLRVAGSGVVGGVQAATNNQDVGEGVKTGLLGGVVGEGAGAVLSGVAQAGRKLQSLGYQKAVDYHFGTAVPAENAAKAAGLQDTLAQVRQYFSSANPDDATLS